jgi:limonene-1,2-epoxide hydrolase
MTRLRAGFEALRRPRVAAAVAAALVAVVVLVAVAAGGGDDPPLVSGTAAEAVAAVDAFSKALADRDYASICDKLFSADARVAAGGDDCQSVLAQAAARLRAPRVRITSVAVGHGRATVSVMASVAGQRPAADVIRLVRERGRFRIDSAGLATGGE